MKIGILQTGHVAEALQPENGDYDSIFVNFLDGYGFEFQNYPVVDGIFPDGPEDCDGWLITGSKHGAYEDHDWIPPLEDLIRAIRATGRPMIGVCFGHQIIAQALGGKVEKYPGGWAVGRHEYDMQGRKIALNAWHQDQVTRAPEGAEVICSNDFCTNAALLYGDNIFTIQPHPEINRTYMQGLIEVRAPGVVPDPLRDAARAQLDAATDSKATADMFARFFKEKRLA
jgi:GMP synthase-like glutamine amidotransferase